ncbi:guanine nucleotide exchange factor SPIKE 1, partial [Phalaenopsis equestris]|uniref:guanine nucleotide exchange factor SPIKE 1 n=1 Tax=Phalaenopsis equestris TaxID=78828 RepID=UPI0009E1C004
MALEDIPYDAQRFKKIQRKSWATNLEQYPWLDENLEQWPHLNELVQCYKADWIKDEYKYGRYDCVSSFSFQNQIYEGIDTDMETEMRLTRARDSEIDDFTDDDVPSTSGRPISESCSYSSHLKDAKHFGDSPLPAYEPTFDWENERLSIFGQRTPEPLQTQRDSGLKISVKVLSLSFQAGLTEPFYGTICLYNKERREKLSEDFYFDVIPTEMKEASFSSDRRGIFSVDALSASICLLIQLEKCATEDGGVTSSIYSRNEPINLTEKEKQKLQVWTRMMPYKECFAWTFVTLFENQNTASGGGAASPGSPFTPSISGLIFQDGNGEPVAKVANDGKLPQSSSGSAVIVEISSLNKVKESYTEDTLQDPKRKVHKPVKGTLRLEVEKFYAKSTDSDNLSEAGSVTNSLNDVGEGGGPSGKHSNGSLKLNGADRKKQDKSALQITRGSDFNKCNEELFEAFDFRVMFKSEPFTQLIHCLYLYPLTVCFSRKRNLFIRVEMKKDDGDIRKQPIEAMYPRGPSLGLKKWANTQVAVGARIASYHDEIKICLPALLTPQHHLLFSFFHIDLQTKLEAPKPVVVGYAVLPLSIHAQLHMDISLPIMRELGPQYLQDAGKERLDYLEDGKTIFKLRLRLCSTLFPVNERIRDFFLEYDRHILRTSPPWGSELLEAINSLKNVESSVLLQFLQPILNMLLNLIGDGGETLQVAAFRAMVNILTRVQQESSDGAERNRFLVNYVDYTFDDFGGQPASVYPGLCTVWGSLARSKAKGYRVGPVYDDVLAMAWFFLELIVKSMALEQNNIHSHNIPAGEDIPPLQLKDGVFRCIVQLFDCLLAEVHERCKKGLSLAKRLNGSLAFFCFDLLSVIEPRLVFELVSLYMDKFAGVCQSALHDCKLTFLQIICDHDLFVEMPGKDPSDRNYLASLLIQEAFVTLDHEDLLERAKAARILVFLMCKHEFDLRYQKCEDRLYIAQLYFPLIGQILDEMPVFYNLNVVEKREVLIVFMQIIRNLDDASLVKAWQQGIARTRLFFKLLEECLTLFDHRREGDCLLVTSSSRSPDSEGPLIPKYSDLLSPAINTYLSEASRQELKPQGTPENGYMWHRVSPQISSPSQPYSLREALAQAQSSRIGASTRALRESLHPLLRQKLELWEENLSAAVSLLVLELAEKFSNAAASHAIATDYAKLDCITSILTSFFSRSQPLSFWKAFFPVFNNVFNLHGATLMARENDRFLKQVAFHLLRLSVFRNDSIRRRAVIGLQILIRNSFYHFGHTTRLRVMLTITLSELMSEVQVTRMRSDGSLEETGEARFLRKSLEEMADEGRSAELVRGCGLPPNALEAIHKGSADNRWTWLEVKYLSDCLILALDAGIEHALLAPVMTVDRYAAAESFYKLAMAYAPVPDLHIVWLLNLCDLHQEMQSWAEAAQCAVAVAGVIMQALVGRNDAVWTIDHVVALQKICPIVSSDVTAEASAAEFEGYGASKLTVDSAVKYLQLANKLFAEAELYHFCASILELIIPVYKSRRLYGQIAKCLTSLTNIYESIVEQESSPIPFIDGTYYRVGFYGERFGKLDRKEYVYREPRDVRLGDIMEKLSHIYESRMNESHTLHIIPDSRQVNAEELQPGVCYLQITAVDPVMEDEDLGSRRERIFSLSTGGVQGRVFNRFLFDTPFTKNGKSQGGLEDQWKRRTVLQTVGSFPALVRRLVVIKSESLEFSPVENAIGMIETRTAALRNELEEPRSSEGDQLPRLQSLQRILQGSVAVQVNSGVLSVCTA